MDPETAAGIPGKPSAYPLTTGAAHIPTGFSVFQAACQKQALRLSTDRRVPDIIRTGLRLFPAVYENEMFLTMSETIGHLDVLAAEGKAVSFQSGNTLMFKAVKG